MMVKEALSLIVEQAKTGIARAKVPKSMISYDILTKMIKTLIIKDEGLFVPFDYVKIEESYYVFYMSNFFMQLIKKDEYVYSYFRESSERKVYTDSYSKVKLDINAKKLIIDPEFKNMLISKYSASLNVENELTKMETWLISTGKYSFYKNLSAFVVKWLNRSLERKGAPAVSIDLGKDRENGTWKQEE